jgi:hypothetical protein
MVYLSIRILVIVVFAAGLFQPDITLNLPIDQFTEFLQPMRFAGIVQVNEMQLDHAPRSKLVEDQSHDAGLTPV